MELLFSLFDKVGKTQGPKHPRPGRVVPKTQREWVRRPGWMVAYGADHSLGSGVVDSDSLGSGVVTHDPTHSLGSGVIAADGLGSGVVTHDPTHSLGSGVIAADSLGSGVGDP